MADEKYTFEQARIRLEEIAAEVRKKDTSLEKSLDLLEEGVRLANICTELVDHTDLSGDVAVSVTEGASAEAGGGSPTDAPGSEDSPAGNAAAGGGEPLSDAPSGAENAADTTADVADPAVDAGEVDGFDEADDEVDESADFGIDD